MRIGWWVAARTRIAMENKLIGPALEGGGSNLKRTTSVKLKGFL